MALFSWVLVVMVSAVLGALGGAAVVMRRRLGVLVGRERQLQAQADEMQRQAQLLEQARDAAVETAQLKSQFLATMSHELRTPLNAVLGMASLLGETSLTDEQRDYVGTIEGGSRALLTLIGDILDLSKLDAGKLEPERVIVDVHECADQALALVSAQAHGKKLELVYDPAPGAPTHLVSDPGRLQQVLVNLLSNAVKFTDEGEVTLAVEWVDGRIVFAVRDTGVGIPSDRLPLLFQPFQQIDASSTRRHGGTGLGLAISKAIVELLGGELAVESVAGKGSTFAFSLRAPTEVRPVSRPSLPGERVVRALLLDASPGSRAAVASQLEAQGVVVQA
ncbi:MAG: histidine kinase, partial [Myxococcales bacterium]